MSTAFTPEFAVFKPLAPEDFWSWPNELTDLDQQVQAVVHSNYRIAEAVVLPLAEGDTVASETAALLGALPLQETRHEWGYGQFILSVTNRFTAYFERPGAWPVNHEGKTVKPLLTFETAVRAGFEHSPGSELFVPIMATSLRHKADDDPDPEIIKSRSLMGVRGQRTGWFSGKYEYGPDQIKDIRAKISECLIANALGRGEVPPISAHLRVNTPTELMILRESTTGLELGKHMGPVRSEDTEPMPSERVASTIRVVRRLVEDGKHPYNRAR